MFFQVQNIRKLSYSTNMSSECHYSVFSEMENGNRCVAYECRSYLLSGTFVSGVKRRVVGLENEQ